MANIPGTASTTDFFSWTKIADGSDVTFEAAKDVFVFDAVTYKATPLPANSTIDTEVSAADVTFTDTGSNIQMAFNGKTITLNNVNFTDLTSSTSTTRGNIRFNDESKLLVGTESTTKGDTLTGWFGDDYLMGLAGNDTLKGGAGNDVLDGGDGNDNMTGGTGDDTYIVDSASDVITELASGGLADTVKSDVSYTITSAYIENLTLIGTDDINGTGNAGTNTITGNSGDNKLDGKTITGITDTLVGGDGSDTYVVPAAGAGTVTITELGTGVGDIDVVESARTFDLTTVVDNATPANPTIENLVLTGTSDIEGKGTSAPNTITGNTGNNKLDGGAGADTMNGGLGNDTYVFDNSGDTISDTGEAAGIDTIILAGLSSFTLTPTPTVKAFAAIENITLAVTGDGGIATTSVTGNGLGNVIDARNGFADAKLAGGLGNDTYYIDKTTDLPFENANQGTDTVIFTESGTSLALKAYTLGSNLENLNLVGGFLQGTGNIGNNIITDSSVATETNTIDGKGGNDIYNIVGFGDTVSESAGQGTDSVNWYNPTTSGTAFVLGNNIENLTITKNASGTHVALNGTGNSLNNIITGNDAANTLKGGDGNDTLSGGAGIDVLEGEAGNDSLNGGAGDDDLTGGAGNDTLTLGSGDSDTVIFEATGDLNGSDTISNFTRGVGGDTLDFSSFLTTSDLYTTVINDSSITPNLQIGAGLDIAATKNVFIINDTGTALTNTTVAALIADDGTSPNTSPLEADIVDSGADQYVIISAQTSGSARIWFINSALDDDPTEISAADVKLVGTLSGVNNFGVTPFDADNIA